MVNEAKHDSIIVAAMIAVVPSPSAVSRMTRARHTCFCDVLRPATMVSRRRRSAVETETETPECMPQHAHAQRPDEIPFRTLSFQSNHWLSEVVSAEGPPSSRPLRGSLPAPSLAIRLRWSAANNLQIAARQSRRMRRRALSWPLTRGRLERTHFTRRSPAPATRTWRPLH